MATLLERVKERTNSDLGDAELEAMIDEILTEIVRRYGPGRAVEASDEPDDSIVVVLDGGSGIVHLVRPADAGEEITVTEASSDHDDPIELEEDDFELANGGRILRRSSAGANPSARWARRVAVTYTPYDDTRQRQEVVIKLIELALSQQAGTTSERLGDFSASFGSDYVEAREKLYASLGPKVLMA